ncbi:hypothetical protein F7O93_36190, partial [Pseudomonas aeruginosa]
AGNASKIKPISLEGMFQRYARRRGLLDVAGRRVQASATGQQEERQGQEPAAHRISPGRMCKSPDQRGSRSNEGA